MRKRPGHFLRFGPFLAAFLIPALAWAQEKALEQAAPAAEAAPVANVALPRDLSAIGMFMHADRVVQAIMLGLVLASVATWTIGLVKAVEIYRAKGRARKIVLELAQATSILEADKALPAGKDPVSRFLQTAIAEIRSTGFGDMESLKERVSWMLERLEAAASRRVGSGTGILASVGAIAPFVGLLGTVWGIMNSFIGISNAQTTNLAIVAPGIAEALLATALGLFAAIPAVVIYNALARAVTGYRALVADASALTMRLVSLEGEYARRHRAQTQTQARAAE